MIFDTTEMLYELVVSGELTIDDDGKIWRSSVRRGGNGRIGTMQFECERRRAETYAGRYLIVRAMRDGCRIHTGAHRLVYRHFSGSAIPNGLTINHKNGIKIDNRPGNLELATMREQLLHAISVLGIKPARKLSDDDVRQIRKHSLKDAAMLAEKHGVALSTIKNIIYRLDRANVS